MRTTSSLEGYNSRLAQKLPKKGNFFQFMKCIADEELIQSHDMLLLVESGGAVMARMARKRKFQEKDKLIRENTDALASGSCTVIEFLRRVTYDNKIVESSWANYVKPENYVPDIENLSDDDQLSDEEMCDPSTSASAIAANAVADEQLCIVCMDRKRDTLLLPCRDVKICGECASTLKAAAAEDTPFICPHCKAEVIETMSGIYI